MFGKRKKDYVDPSQQVLDHLLVHFITARSLSDEELQLITLGLVKDLDPVDIAHTVAVQRHTRHLILAVSHVEGRPTKAEVISLN